MSTSNPAVVRALRAWDGLRNLVSGVGTAKDKATAWRYVFERLDEQQIHAMYTSDWLARKIVDIVPEDMTREWRIWQSERAEDYYKAERQLRIRTRIQEALTLARLDGGAALLIGDGASDPTKPLDVERIKAGGIKYLHVFSRLELSGQNQILQLANPDYLLNEHYQITTQQEKAAALNNALAHRSRFVFFKGAKVPRSLTIQTEPEWGLSIFQSIAVAIRDAGAVAANAASLTNEAKMDILKIPDLDNHLSDEEGTKRMVERLTLANSMKSSINTLIIGNDEEWDRKEVNLTAFPDLMRAHLQIASGAADIPVTRLLGQSPAGLNATGDADIRNYYDMIRSKQKGFEEDLEPLDRALRRHVTGAEPEDDLYEWIPLWQMSEAEEATIAKQKADTVNVYLSTNLFAPEELRPAVADMLIEDAFMPTLDQHLLGEEEFNTLLEEKQAAQEEEMRVQAEAQATARGGASGGAPGLRVVGGTDGRTRDAAPRTLYVRRDVKNAAQIVRWAKEQGISNGYPASELHVTIMYSKEPVDWFDVGTSWSEEIKIVGGPRQLERLGVMQDAVVLLIPLVSDLKWRHEEIKEKGAVWDWPKYEPHITIAQDSENKIDLDTIEPYQGEIILGPEIFEEIDEDWEARVAKTDAVPVKSKGQRASPFASDDSWLDAGFGEFEESKHPRGSAGKFTNKSGGKDPLVERWGKTAERSQSKTPATDLLDRALVTEGQPSVKEFIDALSPKELTALHTAAAKEKTAVPTTAHVKQGGFIQSDGTYTPERQQLHNKILQKVFTPDAVAKALPVSGQQPTATFLGGRGGSGKSWLFSADGPVDKTRSIYLNPDDFKEALPEYEGWNAGQLHEESKDLTLQAHKIAQQLGVNVIVDATMSSPQRTGQMLDHYTEAGYEVSGHYMFASPSTAARRAIARMIRTGRYVPPQYTLTSLSNERAFDALIPEFKEWSVYSNNVDGETPQQIAKGQRA
jgi:phage-related protein (TIGR01555 family)